MDTNVLMLAVQAAAMAGSPDDYEDTDDLTAAQQWNGVVLGNATRLWELASPEGMIGAHLARLEKCVNRDNKSAVFVGQIVDVEYEKSSTRYKVILDSINDSGEHETLRTERSDGELAGYVEMLAHKARNLIGRRVLIYKEVQPMSNKSGRAVRICQHLVDLGDSRS